MVGRCVVCVIADVVVWLSVVGVGVVVDVVYDMVCVAVVPSYDVAGVRVIDAGIVTVVGCVVACVVGVVVGSCVFDVRCVYYCRMV